MTAEVATSPKKDLVRSEWVLVTPSLASEWLLQNKKNRPLSMHVVKKTADRMRNGTWAVTHQGIAFDTEGRLMDGQHRLSAIVESGIPHRYNVTWGLDPKSFERMDVDGKGSRRSADLLEFLGPEIPNKSLCCAVANRCLKGMTNQKFEKSVQAHFVLHHEDIVVPLVTKLNGAIGIRSAIIAAFVAAARSRRDDTFPGPRGGYTPDDVLIAAERFARQEWMSSTGDPLKVLFNRIVREKTAKAASGTEVDDIRLYSLTVAALRAELSRRPLGQLQPTTIDWGDDREVVPLNSSAYKEKQSLAAKAGYETRRAKQRSKKEP